MIAKYYVNIMCWGGVSMHYAVLAASRVAAILTVVLIAQVGTAAQKKRERQRRRNG